jgi:hypothetical protein
MYLQGNVSPVTEFVFVARLMNPKKIAVQVASRREAKP